MSHRKENKIATLQLWGYIFDLYNDVMSLIIPVGLQCSSYNSLFSNRDNTLLKRKMIELDFILVPGDFEMLNNYTNVS
jgi:hypothetical protein